jgi:hypothetical protein
MRTDLSHIDRFRLPADVIDAVGYETKDADGWIWQINKLRVVASWGGGWDHVSVSHPDRIPTWEEMAYVKDLFFGDDEAAMQLHPPKSEYVNNHPRCLHLWKPQYAEIPTPPAWMVGIKKAGVLFK